MTRFLSRLLLGALWLVVLPARAQSLLPAHEQRLGVFPAREDIVQTGGRSSIYLSRDGLHIAVVAHAGKQFIFYADGQPGSAYDSIGGVALSPNGGHIAYAAKKGAQWYLVFDGKEGAPCDGIGEAWDYLPQYKPNGPYEGYSFGEISPDAALQFSDDGKHFAYVAQNGTKHRVVLDGQAGPEYDAIGELILTADGQHVAYLAKQGAVQFAVIDNKPGLEYSGVGPLVLSHDGLHVAYVAYQAKKYFVVMDGQVGPSFDFIGVGDLKLSSDGPHFAYSAWVDHREARNGGLKHLVVVDGHPGPEYQSVGAPVFSSDGRHVAYIANQIIRSRPVENKSCVVLDGQPGPQYTSILDAQLSVDGQHLAYLALDHQKYSAIFDGKPGPEFDLIAGSASTTGLLLSPDGRRIAYEARIGVPGHDNTHGFPIANDTDLAQPFIVVDGVSGQKYDGVYQLMFSADSRHVAYLVYKNEHWLAVLDGKEGVEYRHIWGLTFSADGQHLAYVAAKDSDKDISDRMVVVMDGHEDPEYEQVISDQNGDGAPVFTADGSLTYFAVRGGVLYRVTRARVELNGAIGADVPAPATVSASLREYSLGKNGALTATLRVRDDASVSDPDWLQIEINNPGDIGTLTDWRFELSDITVVPADPANKAEAPPANKTASVGISHGVQSLPKGKFILPDNPAALAAATLGLPAQGVWRVRANAGLVLKAWADYEVGESLFSAKTVPIEFIWRAPPPPGNDAQLQWLRQYLASANLENNSALDTSDYQRAVALLKTPAMVMAVNLDNLMSAIDRSKNRPRETLVRLLDEVWAPDARVVAHYRQALVNGDVEAERDLNNYAPDVWADNFVEPLVSLVEKKIRDGTPLHHLAVFILEKHYPVWAKDTTIGSRLHRALEEEPASVGGSSGSATLQFLSADPQKWITQVQLLAYTHDPAVIHELRPFLDNKTLVLDGQIDSSGQALSTRMCDYAHDAILHVLGETGEFGVLQKGGFVSISDPAATGMGNSGPHNWIWPRWDNENAALAKRFDAMSASASNPPAGGTKP